MSILMNIDDKDDDNNDVNDVNDANEWLLRDDITTSCNIM